MSKLSRRSLLQISAGAAVVGSIPAFVPSASARSHNWRPIVEHAARPNRQEQRLFIQNNRTGEVFNDVLKRGETIYDDAYAEIDHLMRDWRRDEIISIDRGLIDLLLALQEEVGHAEPITVVSGYRSKTTNDMLRRRMRKVAKNSYHMKGMAVDLKIKGVSTGALRQIAIHQGKGGVGYYPRSGFVHLDTGPIRLWRS